MPVITEWHAAVASAASLFVNQDPSLEAASVVLLPCRGCMHHDQLNRFTKDPFLEAASVVLLPCRGKMLVVLSP